MRILPVRVFSIAAPVAVAVLAMTVAACGSSGGSSSGSSPSASGSGVASSAPSSAAPTSAAPSASSGGSAGGSAADASQIKANWVAFFNPKTPVAKRVSLLQNGSTFASIIKAQASSPLASSATSSVTAVTVESATQAKVTYSILVGGTAALKNQPGVAVKQSGVWKVGDQSFCALLTLENNGKAPTACAGAAG
ncbi:MAG TPA: hypothetical protein VH089_21765 [Streptosporangiaceae bacterium]|nr:hypothetical protein [Streptosporangiaceae bacterium]